MLKDMRYEPKQRTEIGAWKFSDRYEWVLRRRMTKQLGRFIATSQVMKMKPLLPAAVAQVVIDGVSRSGIPSYRTPAVLALLVGGEIANAMRRDKTRYEDNHWTAAPWDDEPWYRKSPYFHLHSLHVPRETANREACLVAFAESPAKLIADRFTVMKAGRYLTRYFSDKLNEKEIKQWADTYAQRYAPATPLFARDDTDEMIRVIAEGPSDSCMSNGYHKGSDSWFNGHIHPAAIYNTPDIEIGYLEEGGEVTARVICNRNTKKMARAYGDARRLVPAMEALGYESLTGALVGCRIRKIENRNDDGYIMAYVDAGTGSGGGNLSYDHAPVDSDKYWVLCNKGPFSTYDGYENGGVSQVGPTATCDDCDDSCGVDDLYYIESCDRHVCESCHDSDEYVTAYARRGWEETWRRRDCVYCESDDRWYVETYASENDVHMCEVRNEYYKMDDLVITSEGLVHSDEAVNLTVEDSEGNSWAVKGSTVTTHDGRVIHKDSAVVKTVYFHEDDEVDTEIVTEQRAAA